MQVEVLSIVFDSVDVRSVAGEIFGNSLFMYYSWEGVMKALAYYSIIHQKKHTGIVHTHTPCRILLDLPISKFN